MQCTVKNEHDNADIINKCCFYYWTTNCVKSNKEPKLFFFITSISTFGINIDENSNNSDWNDFNTCYLPIRSANFLFSIELIILRLWFLVLISFFMMRMCLLIHFLSFLLGLRFFFLLLQGKLIFEVLYCLFFLLNWRF